MYKTDTLRIGCWNIGYRFLTPNRLYFPWKMDTFLYQQLDKPKYDFLYEVKPNFEENSDYINDKLIYKEENGFYQDLIYKDDKGYIKWILNRVKSNEDVIIYEINNRWNHCKLLYDITNTNNIYPFEYLSRIFSYFTITKGGIVLHGVLMEYEGKGIIISAPSGTGKTTHARMWRDTQRALIINGDRALCRKIDNKWTGFGMPWCGTSGEYINRDVEISAIVVLEQAKENSVEKLDTLQAFNHMIPNITAPTWEKNLLNKAMDYLEDMVNEVPVYKLKCTPDIEAVEVLKKEIDKL